MEPSFQLVGGGITTAPTPSKKSVWSHNWRERMKAEGQYQQIIRKYRLKKYGISWERYEEMLAEQDYKCAICPAVLTGYQDTVIDHDHACCNLKKQCCGKCVRGLLCHHCNHLLGKARDSQEILASAIRYLAKTQI